jgi:hypothetical protein
MHLGRNNLAALASTGGKAYDSTGATIHVSSATTTTFTATSTDMSSPDSVNPFVMTMEATYPQLSTNQMTFRGVATTGDANFNWTMWGVDNSTTTGGGGLLNKVYEDLGTKTSAQSWQFTVDLTLTT